MAAAEGELRLVFDVGSGTTKAAVVRVAAGCRVAGVLASVEHEVLLMHDVLAHGGELSAAAAARLGHVLADCAKHARALGASRAAGIATAVFRRARNGWLETTPVRSSLCVD